MVSHRAVYRYVNKDSKLGTIGSIVDSRFYESTMADPNTDGPGLIATAAMVS